MTDGDTGLVLPYTYSEQHDAECIVVDVFRQPSTFPSDATVRITCRCCGRVATATYPSSIRARAECFKRLDEEDCNP